LHLKLTHSRYLGGGTADHALAVKEPAAGSYESASAKRIADRVARGYRPEVLDLGVLSGPTVAALLEMGARVHVHDVMTPLSRVPAGVAPDVESLFKELKVLPESLDVVLAWELMDFLPMPEARQAAQRLARWLKPKGLILAVFHTAAASEVHRFKLLAGDRVLMEPAGPLPEACPARTNNEALSLFTGFTLLHSALTRTQIREVLGQRNEA
jgi:hypothetical protein